MDSGVNFWDLVIKVKYGDTLKRFSANVYGNSMDHNISTLRTKIIDLFKLNPNADLVLTYVDGDGDIVSLDDDNELHDAAISQHLNPLRINVQLKSESAGEPSLKHGTKSSSERQQQAENYLPNIEEALKSVPEQFRGALYMLFHEAVSKAASSAPQTLAEIVDLFSKLGVSTVVNPPNTATAEPSGTSSGAQTQPSKLNASGESKALAAELSVPSPVQEQEENSNLKETMASKGCTPIDLSLDGTDLPVKVHPSGYPSIDDLLTSAWTKNNSMDINKESSNNHKGKSVQATTVFVPEDSREENNDISRPFVPPSYPFGPFGMMAGDYSRCPSRRDFGFRAPSPVCPGFGFQDDIPINREKNTATPNLPFLSSFQPSGHPYRRAGGFHDGMHRTFHKGVRCDGCGMHPIIGPRFKSKVKEDYDLCNICFAQMGNETDYTRIDRAHPFSHRMFKEFYDTHSRPRFSANFHGCGGRLSRAKLESRFIQDVTVLDGTLMPPATPFTKIWRMRNCGATRWPYGTQLVWVGGDQFANRSSVELEIPADGYPVDKEIDIAVDFISPSMPGRYVSYWRLASPSGQKFGQRVWVLIQVENSRPNSANGIPFNLNLLPEKISQNGLVIIDINTDPMAVDVVTSEPFPSNATVELAQPYSSHTAVEVAEPYSKQVQVDAAQPATSDGIAQPVPPVVPLMSEVHAAEFATSGGISQPMPSAISPVSYPIIDLAESSYEAAPPEAVVPSSETAPDVNVVEKTLLKELEDMGFKQIDLNKEILRQNEYSLEQSVEDLCGFAEWDPLLEELQEMGFSDRAKNKELLVKNGGSIKRVVMDLIAEENL